MCNMVSPVAVRVWVDQEWDGSCERRMQSVKTRSESQMQSTPKNNKTRTA